MSQLYVWRPSADAKPTAEAVFRAALTAQASEYRGAFGRDYRARIHSGADGVLIGQIAWDDGVVGWEAWIEAGACGVAWSGVCESLLAADRPTSLPRALFERLDDADPARLIELDGRFAACAWDDESRRTILLTGPMASPQLWQVEGPRGWAAGSRAAPLLTMVGRSRALDLDAASAFLAFGYLAGDRALFAGVTRIPGRSRIDVSGGERRATQTYAAIDAPAPAPADPVAAGARLGARVSRQLAASAAPALLLTGGRDSRAIGAALAHVGFAGPAFTGGAEASPDVTVARRIAGVLGITHRRGTGAAVTALTPMTALAWTRVSESTQSLRQAVSHRRFFERSLPVPEQRHQLFHGLGGEIARAYYYQDSEPRIGMPFLLAKADRTLRRQRPLEPVVAPILADFEAGIAAAHPTDAQWLDLFYWQNRCLRWGTDLLAGADLMDWHWTPFLDAHWLGDAWNLDDRAKRTNAFIEAVTVAMDVRLAGVAYATDLALGGGRSRGVKRRAYHLAARVAPGRAHRLRSRSADDAHLGAFMSSLLTSGRSAAWHEIAAPDGVARLIATDPGAEALWSLATIESFERAFLA